MKCKHIWTDLGDPFFAEGCVTLSFKRMSLLDQLCLISPSRPPFNSNCPCEIGSKKYSAVCIAYCNGH